MSALILCVCFYSFFLELIVTCRFYVIYVREDTESNVEGCDYISYMDLDLWTMAVKYDHSLTNKSLQLLWWWRISLNQNFGSLWVQLQSKSALVQVKA